jgi:tetratricopeptide (TPR) repeat protein
MKHIAVFTSILVVFFMIIPVPTYSNEDFLKKAQKSMDLMDYEQAIFYYEQALTENPSTLEIRPNLGFCYFRNGKYEDAVRVCQDEIAHFPRSLKARILLSYVFFNQGQSEEMVAACQSYHNTLEQYIQDEGKKVGKEYKVKRGSHWKLPKENFDILRKKILGRHSNMGLPYFILSVHHKKNLAFDKASFNIQRAMLWGYDPIDCYAQLIDIELTQKKWERAIQKARNAQSAVGSCAEFYFLMGYSHYQIGHMDRAEASFLNAFELKPYVAETQKNLAKVHFAKGNFYEAQKRLKQILKIWPLDYNMRFLLEQASKSQQTTKPTQKPKLTKNMFVRPSLKYKYTFKTDVNFVTNLINSAAMTLLKSGRLDEAILMTESFLDIYEEVPELNYNLGHFYNMKNDLDNALKYAWIAADLQRDFKDAYDLIGNIFFKSEDFDSSIKAYNKVIAIDPKDAMSHYNMGCVYIAKGDTIKAEESWLNAIRFERSTRTTNRDKVSDDELSFSLVVVGRRVTFKSHSALGQLYKNQEMWEKSLEQFHLALELEPNRSDLHYEIGKIHIERDNISEAIKSLEKYVYFGGSKEQEVREILKQLKSNNQSLLDI